MSNLADQFREMPFLRDDVVGAAVRLVDDLLIFGRDEWGRRDRIQGKAILLEQGRGSVSGKIGHLSIARVMIVIGLVVLGVLRTVTRVMRRCIGDQDNDAL